jgi:hypothetical protein
MEITDVPDLPPVPLLEGKDDFAQWNNLMINTMQHFGVGEEYLSTGFRSTHGDSISKFIRAKISRSMTKSLINGGSPKHGTTICDWIFSVMLQQPPRTSAADLLRDFSRLEAKDYLTLRDFQARVQVLRYQLVQSECDVGDKPAIWFVLNGLQARYPDWHRSLVRQMHAKKLTWPWLLVEMASEAFHEVNAEDGGDIGGDDGRDVIEIEEENQQRQDNANGERAHGAQGGRDGNRSKRARLE